MNDNIPIYKSNDPIYKNEVLNDPDPIYKKLINAPRDNSITLPVTNDLSIGSIVYIRQPWLHNDGRRNVLEKASITYVFPSGDIWINGFGVFCKEHEYANFDEYLELPYPEIEIEYIKQQKGK